MDLIYDSNLSSLETLAKDIESFGKKENLHRDLIYTVNLCLDELITNIISYGYKGIPKQPIRVILEKDGDTVVVTVKDKGNPFNPVERFKQAPDTESDIQKREVGGLGVFFVKKYMDSIKYNRVGDENELTLVARLHEG